MEIKDILADQSAWLDTLRTNLPAPSAAGISATLGSIETQVGVIKARISDLTKQKAAAMQQFDAAIARQESALTTLEAGAAITVASGAAQPVQAAQPTPPATTRAPKPRK